MEDTALHLGQVSLASSDVSQYLRLFFVFYGFDSFEKCSLDIL